MSAVVQALVDRLGRDAVLTDAQDMAPHEQDWRGRYRGDAVCVVLPRTTQDVSEIVSICSRYGHAIVPQGGNTGLSGGSVPATGSTVVVSTRRMNRILSIDALEGSIVVEAGCVLAEIHAAAEAAGWQFPLRLGAEGSCQIGGNISTNAGGTSVVRYGNCRDLVLGLEVVLPDGDVWDGLRSLRKNNSGYDLKHLFIGAEGTLGIVTKAALKLFPRPAETAAAWVAVASAEHAVRLASRARARLDTAITAIELMNAEQVRLVLKHVANARRIIDGDHPFFVLLEVSSIQADGSAARNLEQVLADCFAAEMIEDAVQAASLAQAAAFWEVRHGVAHANRSEGMGITMDASVPVGRVSAFVDEADAAVRQHFPEARPVIVSHLGDGNVHYIVMVSADIWSGMEDKAGYAFKVRQSINDIAVRHHGGSFSAEHGVGQTLIPEVGRYKSRTELKLLHAVKNLFDPEGLFNPGKLLPPA
jgi:FAD/FMN-containing dehydrogenase